VSFETNHPLTIDEETYNLVRLKQLTVTLDEYGVVKTDSMFKKYLKDEELIKDAPRGEGVEVNCYDDLTDYITEEQMQVVRDAEEILINLAKERGLL
jgi:hypothetical protein